MHMTVARAVFCLSLAATLFWAFGFAAERIAGAEPPFWSCATPAIAVTTLLAFAVFRAWPRFLRVAAGTKGRFVRRAAAWTVVAYVIGAVSIGGLANRLLHADAGSSESLRSEASLAAFVLALWVPLWFAPAIGLCLGWWQAAGGVRADGASVPEEVS